MNIYSTSALAALILFGMAMISLSLGIQTYQNNKASYAGRLMFYMFICSAVWDAGYAWMSLCHGDDFAYIPRAMALFAVYAYMPIVVNYILTMSRASASDSILPYIIYALLAIPSWICVIQKSAVSFRETPWGYWYTSQMSWGRIVQFLLIVLSIIMYYYYLHFWQSHRKLKRERDIIKSYMWFGPILVGGCLLDTLFPVVFHTAAIPGSAIGAFASSILLYRNSEKYRAFGASVANVSEYVFRDVNVPVLVIDFQDRVALYNDITPRFFNRDQSDMIGMTIDSLFEVYDSDISLSGEETSQLYRIKNTKTICQLDKTIIRDKFGDIQHQIIFVQDVSEALKALEMMNESKKMADNANASKSAFLANMSHEIRTPMNAIMGMSDILLQTENDPAETRRLIENIKQSGESLLGIINDVLDISRLESGKYELVPVTYSVADLISGVSSMIKVKVAETSLDFFVEVEPDVPKELFGDDLRIRQILVNLLGNAVKFTEKGSVKLKVWAEKDADIVTLHADVQDTGIGIKEEDLGKVFADFQQVDTHRNRNKEGSGLGLTISRRLAMLMKGDITVESEYGVGSCFHLVIKQGRRSTDVIGEETAKAIELDKYNPVGRGEEFTIIPKPGKRVLIVDDTKVNLMVAKGLMNPYQMTIDTVSSGKQAIEMVQQNDYDIVFMDHMMPELDGVETTHIIRELDGEKYKKLVIVALTANAVAGTREQLMAEGMQEFITKPINKKELNDVLDMFLGKDN